VLLAACLAVPAASSAAAEEGIRTRF
jgi:hypothetical protein